MVEYQASIKVMLKPTVLDPQGVAVKNSLATMGYDAVTALRVGKHLELRLEADDETSARRLVEEMCDQLLANPVVEEYHVELARAGGEKGGT